MFEAAELGHKVPKQEYAAEVSVLREQLLDAQFELAESAAFPVIVLIGGVDGAGKGETVNTLHFWMDPRQIRTNAMGHPTEEERLRPRMWRFWRVLPPRGSIGIFFGSWYTSPIVERTYGDIDQAAFDQQIDEIARFERMLADEGALILKFWFHLSREQQRTRLEKLAKNPATRWRVTDVDRENAKRYDEFRAISEHALRLTSQAWAPWIVVEGTDRRYRELATGRTLLDALRERLRAEPETPPRPAPATPHAPARIDERTVLSELDLSVAMPKPEYQKQLEKLQGRLNLLSRHKKFRRHAVVAVFEGNDAAGKGGAIRRFTAALDARFYHLVPIAAPTEEERAQPYLWRFWRHLPALGHFAIFDRSWYGRVLVERVERLCPEYDWQRAYGEINDFEAEMVRHGIIIVKFWLAVSQNEQFRRFRERESLGHKRFKITDEDWRNREKWDEYVSAVCDMVDRTSTETAPWTLVEANDKYWARIRVLQTLCDRIEADLA